MKIAFVVPWMTPSAGGPAVTIPAAVRELARRGNEVTVVTTDAGIPSNGRGLRPLSSIEVASIEGNLHPANLVVFPITWPARLARSPELARFMDAHVRDFDVVNIDTLWLHPTFAAGRACFRAKVPYILSPHGAFSPAFARRGRVRKFVTMLAWQRKLLERSAAFRLTSRLEDQWMREIAPAVRRFVFPHALEGLPTKPRPFGDRDEVIIWAGRLAPVKRADLAILAMAYVPAGCQLLVVGPDSSAQRDDLVKVARRVGVEQRVRFVGEVPTERLREMLAGARATVVPSDNENLSMVAVESMLAGTPVVLRDTVGVCDIVSRYGAGAIVSAEPAVIGRALARLVSDETSFSAAAAGAHAAAMEFSWDVVGDQLEQMEQWAAQSAEREGVMLGRGGSPR